MDSHLIAWDARPREIAADPAATVLLNRERWEAAGARFEAYEDELGGSTVIATGAATAPGDEVAFAVLDRGEATVFLLVAGSYKEHEGSVAVVLDGLIAQGTVTPEDILERLPADHDAESPEPTTRELENKLEQLAGVVAALESQLDALTASGSGPRADVVDPAGDLEVGSSAIGEGAPREPVGLAHALSAFGRERTRHVVLESDEDRFLAIAQDELVRSWASRLQMLPSGVGDMAYDSAMDAIRMRARNGVELFKEERGALSSRRIAAYVKHTVHRKIQSSWQETKREPVVQFDEARHTPGDAEADLMAAQDSGALAALARDLEEELHLARARSSLARMQRQVHEADARRLRDMEEFVAEHRITGLGASVVVARAKRSGRVGVTDSGVEVRYPPPLRWGAVAESLGVTAAAARQAYARALKKLPHELRRSIEDPASYVGVLDDAIGHAVE